MQIFATLNLYGRANYVLIAHLMLTIIDGVRSSRRARTVTLLVDAHTRVYATFTRASRRGMSAVERERKKEMERQSESGCQERRVRERDGEGGGKAEEGEDSGGFSRRDGRCADITDK